MVYGPSSMDYSSNPIFAMVYGPSSMDSYKITPSAVNFKSLFPANADVA